MALIDLTLPFHETAHYEELASVKAREVPLTFGAGRYTGVEYRISHSSMVGTYIDFPGHIKETDNGVDADNAPLDTLLNVRAAVVHLDRESGSGAVTAADLAAACPATSGCGALVVNALGKRRFDGIRFRSVWLAPDAGQWIIDSGAHLLVSDIYERAPELTGIFYALFKAGLCTVCLPVNLHLLTTPYVKLTALSLRLKGVTQLPCRLVAEPIA
jgi:kynurenine formamidase